MPLALVSLPSMRRTASSAGTATLSLPFFLASFSWGTAWARAVAACAVNPTSDNPNSSANGNRDNKRMARHPITNKRTRKTA